MDRRAVLLGGGAICASACVSAPRREALRLETAPDNIRRSYVDGPYGQIGVAAMGSQTASKTPLVLLHATALSSDMFRDFQKLMATDRLVIALDTPGYGRSDPPPAPVSIADYAAALISAINALGLRQVDILGYHTGTYLAVDMAVQRPTLVRRLVLPGIPFYEGEAQASRLERYGTIRPPTDDMKPVTDKWDFWVKGRPEDVTLHQGLARFYDEMQSGARYNWAYKAVFSYPARDRLTRVSQPTLVPNPHGSLKDVSRAAAVLMPNAEVLELPNMDRGVFDIHTARMAQITRDFLDR